MRVVDSTGYIFGEIDSLPGCTQIAISHAVFAAPLMKGHGKGKIAHAERLAYMRSIGYDYAMCTVSNENMIQKSILSRFNWKLLDTFHSDKTGNTVCIYGKHLSEEDFISTRGKSLL